MTQQRLSENRRFAAKQPDRILIVLMGAIGDVVRGLPLATRLKQSWPSTHITWAVEPISRPLVEHHPSIDQVVVFDRPRGFSGYRSFVKELRRSPYDLCIDLQRHFKSGVTSRLSGAPLRLGFDRGNAREFNWLFNTHRVPPQDRFSPKIDQFQRFGDTLGLAAQSPLDFGLAISDDELLDVDAILKQGVTDPTLLKNSRVALLLGSTWESRFWFAEHYGALIDELHKRWGMVSLLIGSKGERAFADEVLNKATSSATIDLVGKTSLRQLLGVFQRSHCAVGSDSGPMHMAAAVGIPVISLWGATSPTRSGPYGSEGYMLQSAIGCSPCYLRKCPGLGRLCMSEIPVEAVLAQVERLFDERKLVQ